MKKRLCLLVLPILLCGVVFWAKQARWNRVEETFRKDIVVDSVRNADSFFEVSVSLAPRFGAPTSLAHWSAKELEMAMADLHLMKPANRLRLNETMIYFENFTGESNPASGFYLSLDRDYGYIGGVRCSTAFNDKWGGFELTPQSCRALKHRILTRWGKEIELIQHLSKQ